jgi:transportin-1
MRDKHKHVQHAACNALAILQEEAEAKMIPYLEPILKTVAIAFQYYHVIFFLK